MSAEYGEPGPQAQREARTRWDVAAFLTIVRHGEPDWGSPEGVDPGLTRRGIAQAEAAGAALAGKTHHAIFASPLRRARETARAVGYATGLSPVTASRASLDHPHGARRHKLHSGHPSPRHPPGPLGVASLRVRARELLGPRSALDRAREPRLVPSELQRSRPPRYRRTAVARSPACFARAAASASLRSRSGIGPPFLPVYGPGKRGLPALSVRGSCKITSGAARCEGRATPTSD